MARTNRSEARKALPHGLPRLPKLNHDGIQVCGEGTPPFPEAFNHQLQEFDPDLFVSWHHPPTWPATRLGRWKIEQCIKHYSGMLRENGKPKHDHTCERIYVWMVQTEDDKREFAPLGENVLNKLREMRANSERFGGQTERGLREYIRHSNNIDHELEARRQAQSQDVKQHNSKFNRRQLSKAFDMIQRHDVARPNR